MTPGLARTAPRAVAGGGSCFGGNGGSAAGQASVASTDRGAARFRRAPRHHQEGARHQGRDRESQATRFHHHQCVNTWTRTVGRRRSLEAGRASPHKPETGSTTWQRGACSSARCPSCFGKRPVALVRGRGAYRDPPRPMRDPNKANGTAGALSLPLNGGTLGSFHKRLSTCCTAAQQCVGADVACGVLKEGRRWPEEGHRASFVGAVPCAAIAKSGGLHQRRRTAPAVGWRGFQLTDHASTSST